jgi:RHS repeat-associated protein
VGDFTLPLLQAIAADGSPLSRAGKGPEVRANEVTAPFSSAPSLPSPSAQAAGASDLLYATFLGGGNWDESYGIAVDGGGATYVTGGTRSSDFPTTPGAFDTTFNGDYDAFMVKLNAVGSALAYTTFLGGGGGDGGLGIAIDRGGAAYVTGHTWSSDFPTTTGAFDRMYNGGDDAFVVKLNATGSSLAYASLLGGSGDDGGHDIAVDESEAAYVMGATRSSDFPTTPGAFDATFGGGTCGSFLCFDAFVAKLNATGSALAYATFLGGSGTDEGYGVVIDGSGAAYVAGQTGSSDFPTTAGAFDGTFNSGGDDAFVVKLNDTGSSLAYATFLGGGDYDGGHDIAVDESGAAYVTGSTRSSDFPSTSDAFKKTYDGTGLGDAFVVKLNATGSALAYATFLGGSGTDEGYGVAVESGGATYITGWTYCSDFPTTLGAFDTTFNGGYTDIFVVKLNATGSTLAYATFLGGGNYEEGQAIAIYDSGMVYVTGRTFSSDFPATSGVFDTSFNGYWDAFVAKLAMGGGLPPTPYQTANLGSPSSPTNQTVAEPVSVIFGNYTYQHTDLSLPGRGLPVALERTYNSITPSVTSDGPFGYGWTHAYALTTTQETTSTVMVKNQDGRLDRFTKANGTYTAPPGTFNTLTKNPDGTFTLVHKDQTSYNFNLQGRLASIVDKNGNTTTLTYTGDDLTQITDSAGRLTTLTCDANHHITQITDPAGRTNTYTYDANGNLISHTDARGQTTTYAYDANHRLTSITDANGHTFVQNTYDAEGRVVQQRDALNNLITFSYDTANRQTTMTDPLGNQTVYTYDANWRATGETDPLGHTIAYTYEAQNNRLSVTDKNGNTTRYAYDAHGNTTIITDTLGYTTTMTYDAQNDLTSRTDALSRVTSYTYDAKSNLLSTTNVSGTTTFAYDTLGQMVSTTDANGHTTQFAYDAYGHQTVITDALGSATTFTYDLAGRKLSETDARGNTTTYTYDANNNLLTATDPLGGVTRYAYDNVGNRTSVTDALGQITTYVYDAKDCLATMTDALGGATTYAYDANNNRTQMTDALSHTTVYTYNAVNLMVQVANPLGQVTAYGYDGVGNRTVVTDALGHASHFAYDALHRLVSVTDPLSHTTSYTYDAVGNKTQVSDANGNITSYAYDGLNRLLLVTDALGGVVTYDYDPVGNKTKMTDANGHVTTYQYDAVNRLTRVTDPLAQATVYGYDAVGNKTSLLDAKGQTTTYTYDTLNRLTQITYPGSAVQYAYDAVGNRTTITDTTGTTTYVYDALNRLASVTSPGSSLTVSYTSDAVGNRTRITYPDGQQVTYAYDAANRLTTATDWASRVTSYSYDPVGNLTAVSYPNSTSASYTYDAANRLLQLTNTGPGGTISGFSYTLDKVGNRTQVAEADGDVLTYTYDALYRLTGVAEQIRVDFDSNCAVDVADIQQVASRWRMQDTDPGWDPLYDLDGDGDIDIVDIMQTSARWGERCEQATYTYDAMGNRLSMTTPAGTITYTYDAADRLLSTSAGTAFTWDANGNLLSKGTTTYAYDAANRLTQVVSGTTTAQFTYDGDGKRFSKTANGTATHYLYDVNTSLPVILAETTGGADTLYTYGADLIATTAPGGIQTYYHYDGLGSTRSLSDGTGAVIASYTYGAFGDLRLMKGSSDNTFQFTGEQTDDETGLLYLRARYYDPGVGRFISKDPFSGLVEMPSSLNRYSYAQNNPVMLNDPTGKVAFVAAIPVAFKAAGLIAAFVGLEAMKEQLVHGKATPEQVAEESAKALGKSVVKHEVAETVAGTVGEASWRLGTRMLGPSAGGLMGEITSKAAGGAVSLGFNIWDFLFGSWVRPVYAPDRETFDSPSPIQFSDIFTGGGYGGGGGGSWGRPPSSGK